MDMAEQQWPRLPPARRKSASGWNRVVYVLFSVAMFASHLYFVATHIKLPARGAPPPYRGSVVAPTQLKGTGRIWLVRLGAETEPYSVVELAAWLREKYSLTTEVLPAMPLNVASYDRSRRMYIVEQVLNDMKQSHPELAADPGVVLIGVTDNETYAANEHWSKTFTERDHLRAAIITTHDISGFRWSQRHYFQSRAARLSDRLHRILLKDVALIFWHLSLNNDRGSILYTSLDPYLPGAELYQTDLDPIHTPWGLYLADPCIVFTHAAGAGISVPSTLFERCQNPESVMQEQVSLDSAANPPDTSIERIELRLGYGLLTAKHTDFYLPGAIPIRFERSLSNLSEMPEAFGMSGSHNYDRYLVSHDSMRTIAIDTFGSGAVQLTRYPSWLALLPFNTWVDTDSSGYALKLRWYTQPTQHFLLSRFNGETESYLPCTDAQLCYLTSYTNPVGQTLTLTRDSGRNLTHLSAPQEHWLQLEHGDPQSGIRITSILDSQGRRVSYSYSASGQLVAVSYPGGETMRYTWDNSQNLLSVAAERAGGAPVTLVTNRYDRGRLVGQTLADGSVFAYAWVTGSGRETSLGEITTPDGSRYDIIMGAGSSAAIRAHQAMPVQVVPVPLHHA